MSSVTPRRKILVIEDEPTIRNVLYVLLAGFDCESEIAHSGQQALGLIARDSFDAVLLDLRSNSVPAEEMVARIKQLQPSLVGRVLVISGEVTNPKTLEWLEGQCLTPIAANRLMQELWGRLRGIFGLAASSNNTA
jgi:DNA-binding NtrC family response regulator